jgi:integrase
VRIYRPRPSDAVLFGPTCIVAGCRARGLQRAQGATGHLCGTHARAWGAAGEPPQADWAKHIARGRRGDRIVEACVAAGCRRSADSQSLCGPHHHRWQRSGRPPTAEFAANATAVRTGSAACAVPECDFPTVTGGRLCDGHNKSYQWLRRYRPDAGVEGYVQHLLGAREKAAPRFDMRDLGPIVWLELAYALQCRHDQQGAAITPLIFGQVVRWMRDEPVDSLLIGSDAAWAKAAAERFPPKVCRNPLAWVRYCRGVLQRLRDERHGGEVWEWDTWPVDRLDIGGRYAHQPVRRIYFAEIEPDWLKALAKRWARWRLTTVTKSPASIAVSTSSLRRFTSWLAHRGETCETPAGITRRVLEDYRAHVHTLQVSAMRRNGLLTDLKVFLDDVRLHEWAPDLPANATYYRGEIPAKQRAMPRFIDEFVMGQIDNDTNLDRLDETMRTLVLLLIETGLRSVDARHLPFDPVTTDQASAPYLRFRNHKLSREAIIPISQRLLDQIRRQQGALRTRHGFDPPLLLPRKRANPTGERAMDGHYVNLRIARWMNECGIRDANGQPARVTSHQFRHTLGTRMINNEVPLETVQRMLDHATPEMTARYATIKDQTLRREWERFTQRINVQGELIPLEPAGSAMSDAAWALENLSRAKQTLANGYCGLPLQQTCPHPNACLTCDSFLTTAEFLPQHRDQLTRTEQLITQAQVDGRQRLVDMNEPVRLNLVRIIDGLESVEVADAR